MPGARFYGGLFRGPATGGALLPAGGRNPAAENRQISSDNRVREGYNGDRTQTEGAEPMERAEWKEYRDCVAALLAAPEVARLKTIRHHPGVSCYEHSAFVSYVAWRLARRWGADGALAARAGLLHDLYLYDPRSLPSWRQCFAHPVAAARNAAALRGGLSPKEENCILAHMWPLSVRMPHSREAAAVCLADKLCSVAEVLHVWRRLALRRAMLSLVR